MFEAFLCPKFVKKSRLKARENSQEGCERKLKDIRQNNFKWRVFWD